MSGYSKTNGNASKLEEIYRDEGSLGDTLWLSQQAIEIRRGIYNVLVCWLGYSCLYHRQ